MEKDLKSFPNLWPTQNLQLKIHRELWEVIPNFCCVRARLGILLPTFEAALLAGEISYGTNMSVPRVRLGELE